MDEIILANIDWLIGRCGGYVDEYGDVLDCEGNVIATAGELSVVGLTPATKAMMTDTASGGLIPALGTETPAES